MGDTPRSVDDLSADWLAATTGLSITSIDVQRIAAGEGFMGQLARVRLTGDDVPATVIVKLPTADPGGQMIGQMMRVWEREHCFYRNVAPLLNVRVPRVYGNLLDPPCLVLEDLAPAVPGDHVAGATVAQAEAAIDVLARHHAHWWESPRLYDFDWLPGLDDPMIGSLETTFAIGWPLFLDRYSGQVPDRCLRWCEAFVERVPSWIAEHLTLPVTLSHGDFRLDNLFFAADGSVAVIDWQLSMRVPGGADLTYFCANNLTIERRRAIEWELIDRYIDGLRRGGVATDGNLFDEVRAGYIEGLMFYALSFAASVLTLNPANERGAALFDEIVFRTFAAVEDHDAGTHLAL